MLVPSPILTVCAGNICRSPFAEFYLRHRFQQAEVEVEVFSRGLLNLAGKPAPMTAIKVAAEFDIDLTPHTAQPLLLPDIDRAGLILVMQADQRQQIAKMRPMAVGKACLLSQPSPPPLGGTAVRDPMSRSEECFREVYQEIVNHTDAWLQRFGL
ncbi:MAG: hypothetical protein R8M38_01390 [Mariprofundaceae bacterium]